MVVVLIQTTCMIVIVNLSCHASACIAKLVAFAITALVSHCRHGRLTIILVKHCCDLSLRIGSITMFRRSTTRVAIILLVGAFQIVG